MIPLDHWLAFVGVSLLMIAVPGPSVLFTVGRSIALGRRAGLLSVVGNALGVFPAVLAVVLGVGAVVAASVTAFTIVKLAGAAYLVFLGVQAIRHRADHARPEAVRPDSAARLLRQGFVVSLTNPKTIAFFVAVLPQFVDRSAGAVWLQLLVLGVTFQVVALLSDSVWALAAGTARNWFAGSPRRLSTMTGTGGVMMIALGGTLALTGHRK